MSWFVYGATIPLEINWPSGIVATSVGLAACGVCLALIGLAARAFGGNEGKIVDKVVFRDETHDQPRRVAA